MSKTDRIRQQFCILTPRLQTPSTSIKSYYEIIQKRSFQQIDYMYIYIYIYTMRRTTQHENTTSPEVVLNRFKINLFIGDSRQVEVPVSKTTPSQYNNSMAESQQDHNTYN